MELFLRVGSKVYQALEKKDRVRCCEGCCIKLEGGGCLPRTTQSFPVGAPERRACTDLRVIWKEVT